MEFVTTLVIALRSLRRTLLRSSLTALGVIIGVAAVIALLGIGNGAKSQIERYLAGKETSHLALRVQMPQPPGPLAVRPVVPPSSALTLEDYRALRELPEVVAANPEFFRSAATDGYVQGNGRSVAAIVVGMDVDGFTMRHMRIVAGAPFGAADIEAAASVCVITEFIAASLFQGQDAMGQFVRIQNLPFQVIGIKQDDPTPSLPGQAETGNNIIAIPYTSLLQRLDRAAMQRMLILLQARSPALLPRLQQQVGDLMEQRRGDRVGEYTTSNMAEIARESVRNSQTLTVLLASIGAISLLVGGIGIMNIMMVSVTERTREIGIRLAIGTRERDVLRQFLIEAMTLSVLGGVLGIALGAGASHAIGRLNDLPIEITVASVLGAFVFSGGIGIFFGWYPARQAARLDPIEALRAQ